MTKLAHVGLTVSDIERSAKFYSEAFGFEEFFHVHRETKWISSIVGFSNAHLEFSHMRLNGMHLELIQYHRPGPEAIYDSHSMDTNCPGNVHFCLNVDDIGAATERAFKAGAWMYSDRVTEITIGPNKGAMVVYLRDPDGITIELFQPAKQ